MSFKWTKLFRSYDLEQFTGTDNGLEGHADRYTFERKDGTTVTANNKEKFVLENHASFLGYHSDDMRTAFPFKTFNTLEEAKNHFNLEPHPAHTDRIISTKVALHDKCTMKITLEFNSNQAWKDFVEVNHDPQNPITHGMKEYNISFEYDKDYPGGSDHL